jgi:hypothetical protein
MATSQTICNGHNALSLSSLLQNSKNTVTHAPTGVQKYLKQWIPTFAEMTLGDFCKRLCHQENASILHQCEVPPKRKMKRQAGAMPRSKAYSRHPYPRLPGPGLPAVLLPLDDSQLIGPPESLHNLFIGIVVFGTMQLQNRETPSVDDSFPAQAGGSSAQSESPRPFPQPVGWEYTVCLHSAFTVWCGLLVFRQLGRELNRGFVTEIGFRHFRRSSSTDRCCAARDPIHTWWRGLRPRRPRGFIPRTSLCRPSIRKENDSNYPDCDAIS